LSQWVLEKKACGFSQIKSRAACSALAKAKRKFTFSEIWLKPLLLRLLSTS
jgi:hypothetical protein